jgi:hypothetical protein
MDGWMLSFRCENSGRRPAQKKKKASCRSKQQNHSNSVGNGWAWLAAWAWPWQVGRSRRQKRSAAAPGHGWLAASLDPGGVCVSSWCCRGTSSWLAACADDVAWRLAGGPSREKITVSATVRVTWRVSWSVAYPCVCVWGCRPSPGACGGSTSTASCRSGCFYRRCAATVASGGLECCCSFAGPNSVPSRRRHLAYHCLRISRLNKII